MLHPGTFLTLLLVVPTVSCGQRSIESTTGEETSEPASQESILFEDFEAYGDTEWGTLPPAFWLEGAGGGASARIEDGRLLVDATRQPGAGCTVWLDSELPEAVEIRFDVHVQEAIDLANNMNLLVHFRDPEHDQLRDSRGERDEGTYALYHSGRLNGTIITYVANGNPDTARVRVRRVPPFNPVVQEFRGYHAKAGHTYHVLVKHWGNRLQYQVDGETILDTPLGSGRATKAGGFLGFRTWNTKLWWDNLQVRDLAVNN